MDNKLEEIQFLKSKIKWEDLPSKIKLNFNSEEEKWKEFVMNYSVSYQLIYRVNHYVPKEETYYRELITHMTQSPTLPRLIVRFIKYNQVFNCLILEGISISI
ncbi:hypothetical protein MXB_3356 [Myxobolus squamalis]|nr:hypothetical protein MXB_3356 [Myxobolus squamalis]